MELALYCPEMGYYERDARWVGRGGDFFTSVSVGSLFGELLAFQFAEWLDRPGRGPVQLVEAGAHDGQLAFDILTWLRESRLEVFDRLEYWLVEPSARRQAWQRVKLDEFAGRVRWWNSLEDISGAGIRGIVFSNELIDAFPVRVLRWDALERRWREWGIGLKGGEFAWQRMATDVELWREELHYAGLEVPALLAAHLPDGFTVEFSTAAADWWRKAAASLQTGKLLTIDYGDTAAELLTPQRHFGTLRAYSRHRVTNDVLANPGGQDLTAHVNFMQLRSVAEAAGLVTDAFLTQSQFLTRILEKASQNADGFGEWTPARTRQWQTLTHPEHLGRPFRVLIQSRNG